MSTRRHLRIRPRPWPPALSPQLGWPPAPTRLRPRDDKLACCLEVNDLSDCNPDVLEPVWHAFCGIFHRVVVIDAADASIDGEEASAPIGLTELVLHLRRPDRRRASNSDSTA